ncbi:unnamed protein product, partial [Symbiodinium sp. CCMP2592]
MKQARHEDALRILREVEDLVKEEPESRGEEDEEARLWEFFETLYRNIAWALSAMSKEDEALAYVDRAISVKQRVGREPTWFDFWDQGRLK